MTRQASTAAPLHPAVPNYYQTNVINRASSIMAECTRTYVPAGSTGGGVKQS